jgi:pimeloyl-ACP methyl ester carboxylesterase
MGPKAVKVMKQSPLNQLYPDAGWTVLFTKFGDLLRQDYDWSRNVAEIKSPVMLVFADADAVHTAHVMDIFALLGSGLRDAGLDGSGRPTAQLAVLPGMTHYNILSFPTLSTLVTRFLDALMSEAE